MACKKKTTQFHAQSDAGDSKPSELRKMRFTNFFKAMVVLHTSWSEGGKILHGYRQWQWWWKILEYRGTEAQRCAVPI